MNEKTSKQNPNGKAIFDTLANHKGEILAFAEIANMAGIEAKTGFLTAAKKIATENKMTIQKVEGGVKATAETVTTFPNGFKQTASREVTLDGYRLVDGVLPKDQLTIQAEKLQPTEPTANE